MPFATPPLTSAVAAIGDPAVSVPGTFSVPEGARKIWVSYEGREK
jgi:hypothetical protein